ncbi:MAG: hypothetical protein IEMM0002_0633 [bacterium]|nr:MAG: hypothetical protein IEMM0002_0633 [bacterium]
MNKNPVRTGQCNMCGECCRKLRITSVLSHILDQHGTMEEAKTYYSYRGIRLAETNKKTDRVLMEIDVPCSKLTQDNKCLLHVHVHETPEIKPFICRRYPWYVDDQEDCGYSFEVSTK